MDIYKVGMPFVPYIKKAVQMTDVDIQEYVSASMPEIMPKQQNQIQDIIEAYHSL